MRSQLRVLSALLVGIGVIATSASAGTEQTSSAPPPVGRVAREMPPGAKSVIVFVSVRRMGSLGLAEVPEGAMK